MQWTMRVWKEVVSLPNDLEDIMPKSASYKHGIENEDMNILVKCFAHFVTFPIYWKC